MKWLLLNFVILSTTFSFAQNFEWLSTGHNMQLDVIHAAMNSKNEMMVVSVGLTHYYIDGSIELTSARWKDTTVNITASEHINPNEAFTFSSYDAKGNFLWVRSISDRFITVHGLDCNSSGEFELLCYLEGIYDQADIDYFLGNEIDDEESEDEEYEEEEKTYSDLQLFEGGSELLPRYVRSGYYSITLDSYGNIKKASLLADETMGQLDISAFSCNSKNELVVVGHFDKDLNFPQFAGQKKTAGGDFIFVYDENGQWLWGELGSYQGNSCCSYYDNSLHMTISPDGTVYVAGTTMYPIEFSNGKKVEVTVTDTKKNRSDKPESYLAAFDRTGKMLWLKQSNSPVFIQSMAASDKEVFVAYNWNKPNSKPFGIDADTTGNKNGVIASFSKSGKINWNVTEGSVYVQRMVFANKKLYVAGTVNNSKGGKVGNYQLKGIERSYISTYSTEGKFLKVKPLLPDFDYKVQPVYFYPVTEKDIYVAYSTFCSLPVPLKVFDRLFGKLNVNGDIGVIGKFNY